jgi:hypothetical protein
VGRHNAAPEILQSGRNFRLHVTDEHVLPVCALEFRMHLQGIACKSQSASITGTGYAVNVFDDRQDAWQIFIFQKTSVTNPDHFDADPDLTSEKTGSGSYSI